MEDIDQAGRAIAESIESIEREIDFIARERSSKRARLIVVSKGVDLPRIDKAIEAGASELGESRVQEARAKFGARDLLGRGITLHMIGALQTNKAKQAVEIFSLIHSIDRVGLIEALGRAALGADRMVEGLIQVNIDGDRAKSGCAPKEALELAKLAEKTPNLKIVGVMTIPTYNEDPETTRPTYRALRDIRDDLDRVGFEKNQPTEISAGMSHDYRVALEEGATMIRVGSEIFGARGI